MSILVRLAASADELPEGMRRIAACILADPAATAAATITELADLSETSPATVNRFCRRLGFTGYNDLRLAIATDNGRAEQAHWQQTVGSEVHPDDPLDRIATIISGSDIMAIQQTLDRLDMTTVDAVVTALSQARQTQTFGVGGSYLAADELRHRLAVIGLQARSWSDVHNGLTTAAMLGPEDILVAFSHSGRTRETLQVLTTAAESGAATVAITSSPTSPLALTADHNLVTSVTEGSAFRSQALAARHSQLFLIDLIFVAVANRNFEGSRSAFDKAARAVEPQLVGTGGRARRSAL